MDRRRTREDLARIVRQEVRAALQDLLPAARQDSLPAGPAAPAAQPQPLQAQPASVRRLKLGRSPVPVAARAQPAGLPPAGLQPGGGQQDAAQPGAAQSGGAQQGGAQQGGAALTGEQLLKEMEANLLRLRQVIGETQALAERMEDFLEGDARGRFAGPAVPGGNGRRRNPF